MFAVDQGWLETNPVGRFKCTYEEPNRERLTMEEIMALYHKEFASERLTEIRDVFLFSCDTRPPVKRFPSAAIQPALKRPSWKFSLNSHSLGVGCGARQA